MGKKDPLISIVVPNHNGEKYLGRCLDSISSQNYQKLEIIVVDDGSSDNSVNLIKDAVRKDKRIRFIKREKCLGPNLTRKAGVKVAKGDYILFVDSDDYINCYAVDTLVRMAKKYDADVVRFNYRKEKETKAANTILEDGLLELVVDNKTVFELLLTTYKLNSLWCQMYKREIIKGVRAFDYDLKLGEDFVINLEAHKNTNKMLILNGDPLYVYCDNPESITRSTDRNTIVSNIANRVVISHLALKYVDMVDLEKRKKVLFTQIKMVRDYVMRLARLRGYRKQDFMHDIKRVLSEDEFSSISSKDLANAISGCGTVNKMKYGKIVKAIASSDYDSIWKYLCQYKRTKRFIGSIKGLV